VEGDGDAAPPAHWALGADGVSDIDGHARVAGKKPTLGGSGGCAARMRLVAALPLTLTLPLPLLRALGPDAV